LPPPRSSGDRTRRPPSLGSARRRDCRDGQSPPPPPPGAGTRREPTRSSGPNRPAPISRWRAPRRPLSSPSLLIVKRDQSAARTRPIDIAALGQRPRAERHPRLPLAGTIAPTHRAPTTDLPLPLRNTSGGRRRPEHQVTYDTHDSSSNPPRARPPGFAASGDRARRPGPGRAVRLDEHAPPLGAPPGSPCLPGSDELEPLPAAGQSGLDGFDAGRGGIAAYCCTRTNVRTLSGHLRIHQSLAVTASRIPGNRFACAAGRVGTCSLVTLVGGLLEPPEDLRARRTGVALVGPS